MKAVRAIAAAALALLAASGTLLAESAACAPDRLDIRGDWGEARFSVELAATRESQACGLMFRESLAASHGMLFVYERPGTPAFWMKNTLIPLDMLFITPEGVVQHVHPEAVPGDETPIRGGDGVLAVFEIRGGLASAIGIGPGDEIRHPAFGTGAAWACAEEPAQ
jgi:uncharacterized protein